jgi:hypothetical protein
MVYGCDPAWWKHRHGLPEFTGLKVAWRGGNLEFPDLLKVDIPKNPSGGFAPTMLFDKLGTIGAGGNSGFQAINLAAQLGASRILLLGFDMTDRMGMLHWYGRNQWSQANNPVETSFKNWIGDLIRAAPILKARGVEVIDCSLQGALHCFPKMSLEAALEVDLDRVRSA